MSINGTIILWTQDHLWTYFVDGFESRFGSTLSRPQTDRFWDDKTIKATARVPYSRLCPRLDRRPRPRQSENPPRIRRSVPRVRGRDLRKDLRSSWSHRPPRPHPPRRHDRRRSPRQIGTFATRVARCRRNAQETRDRASFLEEKIDTSSAAGELVFHVFGAIAQFERRLIADARATA